MIHERRSRLLTGLRHHRHDGRLSAAAVRFFVQRRRSLAAERRLGRLARAQSPSSSPSASPSTSPSASPSPSPSHSTLKKPHKKPPGTTVNGPKMWDPAHNRRFAHRSTVTVSQTTNLSTRWCTCHGPDLRRAGRPLRPDFDRLPGHGRRVQLSPSPLPQAVLRRRQRRCSGRVRPVRPDEHRVRHDDRERHRPVDIQILTSPRTSFWAAACVTSARSSSCLPRAAITLTTRQPTAATIASTPPAVTSASSHSAASTARARGGSGLSCR